MSEAKQLVLEQIIWERDVAIQQLEAHGLKFGAIQEPLTHDDIIALPEDPVYVEYKFGGKTIPHIADRSEYGFIYWTDDTYSNLGTYGTTWRCWAVRPTDEERAKAKWEVE